MPEHKPSVLYVTRALTPPWDEASKNFAHELSKHVTDADLTVLTSGHVDDIPAHVHQANIYSPAAPSTFSTRQKFESLLYQWKHRKHFDIVHYFFTPAKLNSFIIRTFFRNRKTRTIQTVATLRDDLLTEKEFHKVLFADRLVTYTRFAQRALERMGFTNVSHAYPGIDLKHFSPDVKDPATLTHFSITSHHFTIMYPGEYIRLGAIDTIVDAMIDFWRSEHPLAHRTILILGCRVKNEADAQKKIAIEERLAQSGFADRVRYTDTFSNMRSLYNISDIVLFPVHNMQGKFDVPLALIEAYACGRPTIVSNIPRLKEFTNDDISVIIESGNVSALTRAITTLIDHPEERRRLGHNARDFTQRHFDIINTTRHYEELYTKIYRCD